MHAIEKNHAFNHQLWHTEDKARREDQGFEYVYRAKREIDRLNQARNVEVEQIDFYLYEALSPPPMGTCPLHSETPGMMIDRLSILSLKLFHMWIQTQRQEVDDAHRQAAEEKHQILVMQRKALHHCLLELIEATQKGTRTFALYKQFKLYNLPAWNPALYSEALRED